MKDFAARYELYDRGVDSVELTEDGYRFRFDLFHCDDPARDEEGVEYILDVTFPKDAVTVTEGDLLYRSAHIFGEVLKADLLDGILHLGIEWKGPGAEIVSWCEVSLSAPPLRFEEETIDTRQPTGVQGSPAPS